MSNYDKLKLGATLNDNPFAGDCHNYGSVSGCDQYCPVLNRGKCGEFLEVLEHCLENADEEQIEDLKTKHNWGGDTDGTMETETTSPNN